MVAKIISLINLKGGVAKTTTTVMLAECLADHLKKNVLVIDLDPQTNATIALIGEEKWDEIDRKKQTIFHLFNDKMEKTEEFDKKNSLQKNVSNLKLKRLWLFASSIKLIDIQDNLQKISNQTTFMINPMEVLKRYLSSGNILDVFDYILIDCPPNLGFITQNGLEVSDYFLIPTIPDGLSTYGIPLILKKIGDFKKDRNVKIQCLGLILTKFRKQSSRHSDYKDKILPRTFKPNLKAQGFDDARIFDNYIPESNVIATAMEIESEEYRTNDTPKTFNQKYKTFSQNVIHITEEFVRHVG